MSENATNVVEMAGLYKKMAGVMGRLSRVPKRGRNEFHKYDYVLAADVFDAVRVAMAKEGLAFFVALGVPSVSRMIKTRNGETPLHCLPLTITFADGDTGATLSVPWIGEAMDGQDKGINKAATSGVKYCLLKTFLISTGEDDPDGDDGKKPARKRAARKPKAGLPPSASATDKQAPHWIDQQTSNGKQVRAAFWAWARDTMGLIDEDVYAALEVDSIHDYTGTMGEAKTKITAWVKKCDEEAGLEPGAGDGE